MKKALNLLTATAIIASAGAPLALAQDSTTSDPASPTIQAPADTGVNPSTDSMNSTGSTNTTGGVSSPMGDTAMTEDTFLTEQSATQISANDFIGASVYTGQDESIGDINDLILEQDGRVVAAIIGVGGFLGIGEKDVALPMSKITVTHDENNDVRLTTMETAESLEAAPAFRTLDEQSADAQRNSVVPTDNTTTSSTGN